MQYNSESTNQDLVSLLNDITGMDNTAYPLTAKTRDMNQANRAIWTWIHEAYGGWQYDDANNTSDFPRATSALVSSQADYGLPTSAINLRGVEVKINGGSTWQKLLPITEEQIRDAQAEAEFLKTASQPSYYMATGNSIKLFPPPNYSQSASLRISYDREISAFTTTDTTKTPGFASLFHEAVAWGAAVAFAKYKGLNSRNDIFQTWLDYEKRIKEFYQSRYQQLFPSRVTVRDAVRESR